MCWQNSGAKGLTPAAAVKKTEATVCSCKEQPPLLLLTPNIPIHLFCWPFTEEQLDSWLHRGCRCPFQHKHSGSRIFASPVYETGGPISFLGSICPHRLNRDKALKSPKTQNLKSSKLVKGESTTGQFPHTATLKSPISGWKIILCISLWNINPLVSNTEACFNNCRA